MGETAGDKAPSPQRCGRGGTHGLCGEFNNLEKRDKLFLRGTRSEPRGAVAADPAGSPRAGVQPASGGPPEPRRKTRLQRKALTHQPGFYSFLPRNALWAHGKQGKCTYLAALRGRPRGPSAAEGAPRSHSPPGRSPHGPSLPPCLPGSEPRRVNCRKREELLVPAPRPSFSAKARASYPSERVQRVPAACRRGGELRGPGAARPGAGLRSGCQSGRGRFLLGPVPAFPCSGRAAETNAKSSGRQGSGGRHGAGRSPGAGGVLGGGAGGLPAPRGRRPPGAPGSAPSEALRPSSAPRRGPPAAHPAPPLPA